MISKDIEKKIELIKITSRKKASGAFIGGYESAFKGQGIEFDEVREYQPGDDVRSIDWNVTARTGITHIKRFSEERELTIIFAVDVSKSQFFGTTSKSKLDVVAEIVSVLSFAATANSDRTGLLLFSDDIEEYIPASKGQSHNLRMVRDLLAFEPKGVKTDISSAVDFLQNVLDRKAIIFILSDFFDSGWEDKLKIAGMKHDVIALNVVDPLEKSLPNLGLLTVSDSENGNSMVIDTSSKRYRDKYKKEYLKRSKYLMQTLSKCGVSQIVIDSDKEWIDRVSLFFSRREISRGRV